MVCENLQHISVGEPENVRKIAVCAEARNHPGLVWLGGFRSDMAGTKAIALSLWAQDQGLSCCRHDYSGHGKSGGDFLDGTISRWLEESVAVFKRFTTGPQILVASSMGAWIAIRLAQILQDEGQAERLGGMILIAPAPDFTHALILPQMSKSQKEALEREGKFVEPSEYSQEPTVFTKALFDDGKQNLVMNAPIHLPCLVHILQGIKDEDVPYDHALNLSHLIDCEQMTLTTINDGDHRLSRPEDIEVMINAIKNMI